MYVNRDHDDRRIKQRTRARRAIDELVANLQRDCPTYIVLNSLVAVARELHLRIEGDDPIRPSRRRAAS
jgi:hypothetical protein